MTRLLDDMREDIGIPEDVRVIIELFAEQLGALEQRIDFLEARIAACHKTSAVSQRLATILGIGPVIATRLPLPLRIRRLFVADASSRLGLD